MDGQMDGFQHLGVTTEADGRVVVVELDHGKANEMGSEQLRELEALTRLLSEDPAVVAAITWSRKRSSRGTPLFVAGANVTERVGWDDDRVKQHVRWQRSVLQGLRAAPVFHIGVAGGVALGWGTEYLLLCDYRIAAEGARFGLPETGLGIVPGAGGTADLWAHVGVAQALRLGMTGERIDAAEALRIGLVQERAPDLDAAMDRARALAALACRRSPTAIAAYKAALLGAVGLPGPQRLALEAAAYERCVDAGEAAIGRASFAAIRAGETPPWGKRS